MGLILELIGYVPNAVEASPTVLLGIRLTYGPLLALFLVGAIIITYLLPMTRRRHNALREAIKAKKAGEKWDEEAIEALL